MSSKVPNNSQIVEGQSTNPGFDREFYDEAQRCLNCFEPPCQEACPAKIPIPEFIRSIRSGNMPYAAKLIRDANPMAAICGAVCPEEVFCQTLCTRKQIDSPIEIRELHRYATRFEEGSSRPHFESDKKIAIIGSGPAGMSASIKLAESGIKAVIFEKSAHPGGVPKSSIPKFRLEDNFAKKDFDYALNLGVEFVHNSNVDNPTKLLDDFACVFVATGLPVCRRLNIKGEDSPSVISAISFLEKARAGGYESLKSKRVVIIGGGNVSLDAASTAAELRADEVRLFYRRGPLEMKVWKSELEEAYHRGVIIDYQVVPLELIIESNVLTAVKCVRTALTDKLDSSGRRIPEFVPDTEYFIPADIVIVAVGLTSDFLGGIEINPDLSTSIPSVFAGGDFARGEGTIVESVRDGKTASESIINYLKEKKQ